MVVVVVVIAVVVMVVLAVMLAVAVVVMAVLLVWVAVVGVVTEGGRRVGRREECMTGVERGGALVKKASSLAVVGVERELELVVVVVGTVVVGGRVVRVLSR